MKFEDLLKCLDILSVTKPKSRKKTVAAHDFAEQILGFPTPSARVLKFNIDLVDWYQGY